VNRVHPGQLAAGRYAGTNYEQAAVVVTTVEAMHAAMTAA